MESKFLLIYLYEAIARMKKAFSVLSLATKHKQMMWFRRQFLSNTMRWWNKKKNYALSNSRFIYHGLSTSLIVQKYWSKIQKLRNYGRTPAIDRESPHNSKSESLIGWPHPEIPPDLGISQADRPRHITSVLMSFCAKRTCHIYNINIFLCMLFILLHVSNYSLMF